MTLKPDFHIIDDPAAEACSLLTGAGGHVVITGGSTPRVAYERAAERRDNWVGVEFWFTDERCVPPDHEHSNYGMVERALLSKVGGVTVHRMKGELGPHDGADEYERELDESGPEAFDLMLLGLGPTRTSARCSRATTRSASARGGWSASRRPGWRRWCRASRLRCRW